MTFSVVGRDRDAVGVAVASKFLAVGSVVPVATAGVGALATQADCNVAWRAEGLHLLAAGMSAPDVLTRLVAADGGRADRQLGIVDATGGSATHTGAECMDWAGGYAAADVAIQGNVLAGTQVLDAMRATWDAGAGAALAHRLLDTLAAGDAAGGDRRGRQSAALYVQSPGAGYQGGDDLAADLRVDDHPDPVTELARLLDLNDFYLTASPAQDRLPVDADLAREIDERVQRARARRSRDLGRDGELRDAGGRGRQLGRRARAGNPARGRLSGLPTIGETRRSIRKEHLCSSKEQSPSSPGARPAWGRPPPASSPPRARRS